MLQLAEISDKDAPLLREAEWQIIVDRLNFSPREMQIVRHVMEDLKEQTIARRLGISPHTVHTHLKRLYGKLGVSSRVELILRIFREYAASMRCRNETGGRLRATSIRRAA